MLSRSIEREFKIKILNKEAFGNLISWDAEDFGGWEARFTLSRKSIFLDTPHYKLKEEGYSLALVLNTQFESIPKNKLVLKMSNSAFKENDRDEIVYEYDSSNNNLKEHLSKFEDIISPEIIKCLEPVVVLEQIRHKRGLFINDKRLFLSFDQVNYLNPLDLTTKIDTLYMCELETASDKSVNLIEKNEISDLLDYITKRFDGVINNTSKLLYGLNLSKYGQWKPQILFKTISDWEKAFDKNKEDLQFILEHIGTVNDEQFSTLEIRINKLITFMKIHYYSNLSDSKVQTKLNQAIKLRNIYNEIKSKKDKKNQPAQLKKEINNIGVVALQFYNELYQKDVQFNDIQDSKGNTHCLTKENYSTFLSANDRKLRKQAFHSLYQSYRQYQNSIAKCLNIIISSSGVAPLESSLTNISYREEFVSFLFRLNEKYLSHLQDYMKKRKNILGYGDYSIFDTQFFIKHKEKTFTFTDAKKIILHSIRCLGETYEQQVKNLFDNGCIDIFTSKYKKTGNFLVDSISPEYPYISINFQSNIQSIIGLAHEIGHALGNLNLPSGKVYSKVPLLTAEIHASVMEALVMKYLQKAFPEYTTNYYLEKYRANYFRQMMLSEFEIIIHNRVKKQNLNIDSQYLSNTYGEILNKYYRDDIILPEDCLYEWTKVPHIYYNPNSLIVYPVAFVIGEHIAHQIYNHKFDYATFLFTSADSDSADALEKSGINLFNEEIYNKFFNNFRKFYNSKIESIN